MSQNFIPLLFAGDINVYSVARAFHEQYNIKAEVFGKYNTGPCQDSRIMNYTANPKADQQDTFLDIVVQFSEKNKDKKIILLGCGDSYVQLISQNKDKLPENIIAPYIHIDMMNDLIHKEKFYAMCEKNGVDYPDTFVHRREIGHDFELPFASPYIIKPSNGIEYWRHPFTSQKKVYKADTRSELETILDDIYQSGYHDSIIIQNFIPGDDTYMRVLTNYSDQYGKVKLMALGHVLLEEHTPHGIGNHAVIMMEHNQELEEKFKKLLEDMNYIGFSNFDIKYDQRDGKFKAFEINTRQGRSNFYVTGAGENIAKYVVEDYIEQKPLEFKTITNKSLWLVVPKGVAFQYIKPEEYRKEMRALFQSGNYVNPLFYQKDKGIIRRLRLLKSQFGHYVKYKKYLGKKR
ncbi:ATP-grasp domain-containing protein [Sinanaerobacter chloroacetimidivorans]|jgi:D-aspartate ligase|uniref:ATP-grasp domain-containing protein n=1 Tax=Sinanaerobacter chloroacetimidivorans TaxID=2818044 RepID=A0A8J7W6Z1_9FIRM|nr:ATP-grasp domain-containing protein [Sinanaerobacter chloroacetimidivorans]MBR0600136.1 ATP-grasp domain-containing protein [Sinanaerobacter chloroacetimidivorans]